MLKSIIMTGTALAAALSAAACIPLPPVCIDEALCWQSATRLYINAVDIDVVPGQYIDKLPGRAKGERGLRSRCMSAGLPCSSNIARCRKKGYELTCVLYSRSCDNAAAFDAHHQDADHFTRNTHVTPPRT